MSDPQGRAIALLAADPASSCLCSDFDGTLAEIVEEPARAAPLPGVAEVLHALASSFARVAVISGRPLAFLSAALGPFDARSRLALFGLYGLERRGASARGEDDHEPWRRAMAAAIAEITSLPPGCELEDKGLTFAVHWRRAPLEGPRLFARIEQLAKRHGLVVHPGKQAIEVLPPVAIDKGSVLAALAQGCRTAAFLGDDVGDLAAFSALDDFEAHGGRVLRVAVNSSEAPEELLARADLVLDGPTAVLAFLQAVAKAAEPLKTGQEP